VCLSVAIIDASLSLNRRKKEVIIIRVIRGYTKRFYLGFTDWFCQFRKFLNLLAGILAVCEFRNIYDILGADLKYIGDVRCALTRCLPIVKSGFQSFERLYLSPGRCSLTSMDQSFYG